MDALIAERNFLQGTTPQDVFSYFSPYLFRISGMSQDSCQSDSDGNFTYPEVASLCFESTKEGIFLMDASNQLFLFLAK